MFGQSMGEDVVSVFVYIAIGSAVLTIAAICLLVIPSTIKEIKLKGKSSTSEQKK